MPIFPPSRDSEGKPTNCSFDYRWDFYLVSSCVYFNCVCSVILDPLSLSERESEVFFLLSVSLLNVNIKLDSL